MKRSLLTVAVAVVGSICVAGVGAVQATVVPTPIDPVEIDGGDILISQTDGVLWVYDTDSSGLVGHPLPFGGTWDIQWDGPDHVLIANSAAARIWRLGLSSGEFELLADGTPIVFPLGIALDPTDPDALWIADTDAGILRLDRTSGDTAVVVPPFDGAMDGIVVSDDGTVYFTNQTGVVYRVAPEVLAGYAPVVDVGPYGLNGLVFDTTGLLLATSFFPSGVAEIDVDTATFTVYDYATEMRSSEDTAVGAGGSWWIIDSGFVTQFGDDAGLYRVDPPRIGITELVRGTPLGDTVDLLVAPPQSKNDCKKGGWSSLVDHTGTPFANQGDCVSYVATGWCNLANG